MLLYVDKKAEKRKKIKYTLIASLCIFFIVANIYQFQKSIHIPNQTLSNYTSFTYQENSWYNKTPPITTYSSPNSLQKIILIPKTLTREISTEIINIVSQNINNEKPHISILSNTNDSDFLYQIIKTEIPNIELSNSDNSLIISDNYKKIKPLIYQHKLKPSTLAYSKQNIINNHTLNNLLNQRFPLPNTPNNKLDKEQEALKNFIINHSNELNNLLNNKSFTEQKLSHQNLLLQNTFFCIKTNTQTYCNLKDDISLFKAISNIINEIPATQKIENLILITSFQETTPNNLSPNAGLLFRFNNRQSIILPQDIKNEPFQTIKQQAGINPLYTSNKMKFYQFKTVEMKKDDNI